MLRRPSSLFNLVRLRRNALEASDRLAKFLAAMMTPYECGGRRLRAACSFALKCLQRRTVTNILCKTSLLPAAQDSSAAI